MSNLQEIRPPSLHDFATNELVDELLDRLMFSNGINFVSLEKICALMNALEEVEINRMCEEFNPPKLD